MVRRASKAIVHVVFQSARRGATRVVSACCDPGDEWSDHQAPDRALPDAARDRDPRRGGWRREPEAAAAGRLHQRRRRRADQADPRRPQAGGARPGRLPARPVDLRPDRGRRSPARQRRGAGLDHLRRSGPAMRRAQLQRQPDRDRADRAEPEPEGRLGLLAADPESHGRLQAAAPEPKPSLHDRDPQRRDHGHGPLGAAVPARRVLRQPDRRRLEQEGQGRRCRRARRRPAGCLGGPGQGPGQPGPGARQRPGAELDHERRAGQHRAAADDRRLREAPQRLLGPDPVPAEGRGPRLRLLVHDRHRRACASTPSSPRG